MDFDIRKAPKESGYYFPAEWGLTVPHGLVTLTMVLIHGQVRFNRFFTYYNQFIKELAKVEMVCINIRDEALLNKTTYDLTDQSVNMDNVTFLLHPTDDAWCRDHGPAFVINPEATPKKAVVSWKYNAWGGKYHHSLDEKIPTLVAQYLRLPIYYPGIVMEGGSVDLNGNGVLLTTKQCLLNENRNPHLSQTEIEKYLCNYYGVEQIHWLDEGIEGDDTNGHIDDLARFVSEETIVTMIEPDKQDVNHDILEKNLKKIKTIRLLNGKQPDIAEILMPKPVVYEGQRLPASYANFYIANNLVVVPNFRCKEDDKAMRILEECFPTRRIIGIDSVDIIWGLGSFHCLSQQEPLTADD